MIIANRFQIDCVEIYGETKRNRFKGDIIIVWKKRFGSLRWEEKNSKKKKNDLKHLFFFGTSLLVAVPLGKMKSG